MNTEIKQNVKKYLWHISLSRALFYLPIFIIFYEHLGISYSKIMFLFSFFSLIKVVFEIPTGALADTIGRKNNLLFSMILRISSLGILIYMAFRGHAMDLSGYVLLIFSTILFSLGEVLESGASGAFIYDYLKSKGFEDEYKTVAAKSSSMIFLTMSITGVLGSGLYWIHTSLPYIVTFIVLIISFIFLCNLDFSTDVNRANKSLNTGKKHIKDSLIIVYNQKSIRAVMLYGAIIFTFFMLTNWQLQIYFNHIGINVYNFGAIFFIYNLLSSYSSRIAPQIEKRIGLNISLNLIPLILATVFFCIGLTNSPFWSLLFSSIIFFLWGYSIPILGHLLNRFVPSETRATIISVQAFMGGIVYGVLSPFLGYLVDSFSINLTLYITGFLVIILIVPFLKDIRLLTKNESVKIGV